MKAVRNMTKALSIILMVCAGMLVSCLEESVSSQLDAAFVAEDALTDSYYEDTDDMVGLVLMLADETSGTGGRTATSRTISLPDGRFGCTGVVVTVTRDQQSTSDIPKGQVVVDFGSSGCTDQKGNIRKGKIIIQFEGRRFKEGSTVITAFDGYSINDIQLEGTRIWSNITSSSADAPRFLIRLENGKAVWPDGTRATRTNCFNRFWLRAINPLNDAMVIDKCNGADYTVQGVNRYAREYQMVILEPLMYKRGCPIAVKGIKQYKDLTTGKVMLVDYGDGECDRTITLTIDGNSRKVDVKKRG
jgi:hypothetical protein